MSFKFRVNTKLFPKAKLPPTDNTLKRIQGLLAVKNYQKLFTLLLNVQPNSKVYSLLRLYGQDYNLKVQSYLFIQRENLMKISYDKLIVKILILSSLLLLYINCVKSKLEMSILY